MRRRWHEWVIVLSIVAIGLTGVITLWGEDLRRLFGDEKRKAEKVRIDGAAVPPPPAPGAAAGPF